MATGSCCVWSVPFLLHRLASRDGAFDEAMVPDIFHRLVLYVYQGYAGQDLSQPLWTHRIY